MTLRRATMLAAASLAPAAWLALAAVLAAPPRLPSFEELRAASCPSDLRVLDRHGEVLHELRTDPTRRRLAWTPLAAISEPLVRSVVASEDHRFFEHDGADWRAAATAAWQWLRGGPPRGASTITMQLAAVVDPSLQRRAGPRSFEQKWRQIWAARALEQSWTKEQILETYLNLVTFRGEVEGIGAAAGAIFDKSPVGLTTDESIVLAASIRAPNAPESALLARARALASVVGDSDAALLEAAALRVTAAPDARGPRTMLATQIARQLARDGEPCHDLSSTIDAEIQRFAIDALKRRLADLDDRSARDAAALVVDNASGEVLAYVGSSPATSTAPQVDGVRARRQAGSALKPFLYAAAIDRRLMTAATLLEDKPLELDIAGNLYRPANYDGHFRGLVSVRTALASSLNVPAVRTLELVGENSFVTTLHSLGFDGLDHDDGWYGPSLALGSADVSLWELVGAYRALAGGGEWSALKLRDAPAEPVRRVFGEEAAHIVASILSDRESRAATFQLENPLATRYWSAVKTGTSKDMRDNWCVGFSDRYTVGVWVGNFSGEPMRDVSGTSGAAPAWRDLMDFLHRDAPSLAPAMPAGVVHARAEFASAAEPAREEWFLRGSEPHSAAVLDSRPRITAPADGSVLAIDPDIPAARQRVPLVAAPAAANAYWLMDGQGIGSAAAPLMWEPVRGRHRLELTNGGQSLGTVRFQVRGPAPH